MKGWISSLDQRPMPRDTFVLACWPYVLTPGNSGIKHSFGAYNMRQEDDFKHLSKHQSDFFWCRIPDEMRVTSDPECTDVMVEVEHEREAIAKDVSALQEMVVGERQQRLRHNDALRKLRKKCGLA